MLAPIAEFHIAQLVCRLVLVTLSFLITSKVCSCAPGFDFPFAIHEYILIVRCEHLHQDSTSQLSNLSTSLDDIGHS